MTDGAIMVAVGVAAAAFHLGALRRMAHVSLRRNTGAISLVLSLVVLRLVPVLIAGSALALWGVGTAVALLAGFLAGRLVILNLTRRL